MATNKIAIYTRVSTEEQAKEGFSLTTQREYLEEYAKREGYEIYKTYSDDGISAYSTRREALQQLLKDAKDKKFELVLVYKIDRFSRNLKDLLNLVDELSACGVAFKSATEPFDTTTSAGKLMFQQLGSFAEFERIGYSYNKEKKLLEVEEREAGIVKLIYTMYLAGKSIHDIAGYLNKKGYKTRTGKQFYTKFLGDVLKNQIYIGKIVWNKHHYDKNQKTKKHYKYVKNDPSQFVVAEGKHEAIIDEEDFVEVQKKLAERKRTWRRREKTKEYLLGGLLTCAKCNHIYIGAAKISNHRTRQKKRWYRCSGPHSSHINCTNRSVKAEDIEPEVTKIVAQLVQNERLKQCRWIGVTSENLGQSTRFAWDSPHFPQKDIKEVKDKLKINQEKQSKLTDAYLENLLGEDVFSGKISSLRNEEDELKKILAGLEVREMERERSEGYINRVKDFLEGYDDSKEKIDFATKKEMCGLLFKNIKIAPARGGQAKSRIHSFEFFAPFNSLFLEQEKNEKCLKNQRLTKKNRPRESISGLSAVK